MTRNKIAFATCVTLGRSCIEKILELGGTLDLLITLKDDIAPDKSGRVYIDDIAQKNNIPLIKIKNINEEEVLRAIKEHKIDYFFVIGWSQIVKSELLSAPKKACLGMHPTLLPEGRGRAAIPWAIIKGLEKTGVTMFKLDEGVDTGDILGQIEIPIDQSTTATELYEKVNSAHTSLIEKYWDSIAGDSVSLTKQDESRATVWEGRKPQDGEIFSTMSKIEADRLVRAVTHPYPGAFFTKDNKKVIIWSAKVSDIPEENSIALSDGYLIPIEFEETEL